MKIGIKVTYDKDLKDFSDLQRHIRRNAEFGAEKALDKAVDKLKSTLSKIVNEEVKMFGTNISPDTQIPSPQVNLPKAKADLVKYIFGQDLKTADFFQKSLNGK